MYRYYSFLNYIRFAFSRISNGIFIRIIADFVTFLLSFSENLGDRFLVMEGEKYFSYEIVIDYVKLRFRQMKLIFSRSRNFPFPNYRSPQMINDPTIQLHSETITSNLNNKYFLFFIIMHLDKVFQFS